ncbi:PKD domain-containing protein [Streptomyces xylophagus]|uniref:PKD domain-containing protein n=1 Tax=Streptomyces xylophagus TaxID=285514 RepID=UPI0005BBA4D6|nr:PKD domain-containing protein [Streptomyces xylophagus]
MRRRRLLVRSIAVLSVLIGGPVTGVAHADTAAGTALYVDDDAVGCSDTGPGSQAEPFCQIQPAADAATAGDTVHVARNKTQYAPVTIASAGTADAAVTFVTAPGDSPTATGTAFLRGTSTPAVTFSGAQYVDVTGFNLSSGGTNTLVVSGSRHITYDTGRITTADSAPGTAETIAVDGSSSGISLTRLFISPESGGPAFASAAGASDITLADDAIRLGGGVTAVGTTGLHLAGDTIETSCGNAVSLTGGSSGSVENTVALPDISASCADTGTPAEITVDASSAPRVTADYNAVNSRSTGTDYDWAGTAYGTRQAFLTGTGQGAHDLDKTDVRLTTTSGLPTEHSPLIDSADADAPGELPTDLHGAQRVDDPLVADTGTGAGDYDRGVTEVQDPLNVTTPGLSSTDVYVGVPVTFKANFTNPWSDSLDGYSYTFDFGDGTTATSTTGSATHTYTQPTTGTDIYATVTTYRPDGTELGTENSGYFPVHPLPALTGTVSCDTAPALPDTTSCNFAASGFSGYPITSDRITYGDGSAAVSVTGSKGFVQHTYTAAGTYTVTQQLTDSGGRTATATTRTTVGPAYVATSPKRVLDTRSGTGAAKRRVGPGGVVRLKVLGVGGIPTSGVTAVTMNVTDTNATASGYVTVYPDGTSRPTASDLDFTAGRTNPNLVTVKVGADGYVDLYNAHGDVDLVADTQGYFTTKADTSDGMSDLAPVTPTRVLDTRNGTGAAKGEVAPGSTTTVTLPKEGQGLGTVGAVLNVTVTGGTGSGVVTVYCGGRPSTSNLNYRAGQTVSNLVVTKVCSGGKIEIYNSGGHVHLIADLQGLYVNSRDGTSPIGSPFVPANPTRFLDTRNGTGAPAHSLGANGTLTVKVAGVAGVPADATAVLVNLTAVGPTTGTHLTAYGAGDLPNVSNDNLTAGETRPILAVVPVDGNGDIHIHNSNGSVGVVADLEGYIG